MEQKNGDMVPGAVGEGNPGRASQEERDEKSVQGRVSNPPFFRPAP
jgi:hypothetical protein